MPTENVRLEYLREIERQRDSRVISLITGDRRGHETRIAGDVIPLLYEHLTEIGEVSEIDLFLYTQGGDSIAGWGIVNLIREFCKKLVVIVPFRVFSCGTLIALGADQVIMLRGGQLSPIDPSVSSPYNPPAPGGQQPSRIGLLPVNVEDVIGFINLGKKEVNLESEESVSKILSSLSEKVHPLALGAVYRAREQISMLAERLLKYHMKDEKHIEKIVNLLTKDLPSHNYLIGRKDATDMVGLNVIDVTEQLEKTIWGLYREYEKWLQLTNPYSAEAELGSEELVVRTFPRAVLETIKDESLKSHVFRTEKELKRIQLTQPGLPTATAGVQERIINEGWVEWTS